MRMGKKWHKLINYEIWKTEAKTKEKKNLKVGYIDVKSKGENGMKKSIVKNKLKYSEEERIEVKKYVKNKVQVPQY